MPRLLNHPHRLGGIQTIEQPPTSPSARGGDPQSTSRAHHHQQQAKKRKLSQPKQEQAVLLQPSTTTSRKPRSRIPFQWRLPSSSSPATGPSTANQSEQVLPDDTQPSHYPNDTPQKVSQKKSSIFRKFSRSHSISSNISSSSTSVSYLASTTPQAALRNFSNHSDSIASRSCSSHSAVLKSQSSDDSIGTRPRPTRSSSPPVTSNISSCSSSLNPSVSYVTDSEFESLSDDHEEVLSAHSHINIPVAPQPLSNSSTHGIGSTSQSRISEASCPPPQCPLPPSPSSPTHDVRSQPFSELPFACPSPNMPGNRVVNRHIRPTPAQAPPLPRSRTPSLVIRPKFATSQHNLDAIVQSSKSSSDAHAHNSASDHVDTQDRPTSRPKSDLMRGLGWGRAPIDPPRLISPSPSLLHNPSSSDVSINRPLQDAIIADYLLAPQNSNKSHQFSSPQKNPPLNPRKTLKDRFTLASTAPLRLTKTQHVRHQSTASATGRAIASSLFGALSPTSNRHTVMDPEDEKRKVEFKRMISYPVLNHGTSGDNDASNAQDKNFQSVPDLDCYNLSIEAAMRSLEGIKPIETASITTPPGSIKSRSNGPEDRPISWTFEDKPDLSDVEASYEFSFTSGKSDAWTQKLRRRVSVNRLMIKSKSKPASSPSPDGRSKNSPSSGLRTYKAAQKQLRTKASARLRPLIRKVSSVSHKQRAPIGSSEGRNAFEAHELDRTGEENEEEELLALSRTPIRRANPERFINSKPESRLRQIRSSISRGHTPRSASSPTVSLTTPQQSKPFPRTSQSIREKRKIFEQPVNPSTDDLPHFNRSTNSSLAISIASSSHSASRGALSTSSGVDRRSSVPSERRQSKRKPTPAEIKLRDETQSVKALVDKFETQHHRSSLGKSVDSDSQKKRARDSSKAGRSSGTGVIRTSLLSLWSGDRSSLGSKRVVSRRVSRQLVLDHRRKASGRSSTESASKAEVRPPRKLKKKPKRTFRDNNSSSSSFGCAFDEEDEYTYELEDPHVDLSLPVKLPGLSDSSNRHLSMLLPKSSMQQKRSTWSVNNSSPRPSAEKSQKRRDLQIFQSRFTSQDAPNCDSPEAAYHDEVDHEPKLLSEQPSMDCVGFNQDRTCSPLSSEQAHKAQTILEPQTIWMGDGSQRQILVAGGCLQVAKKIPFPSFEDDVEFNQNATLEQPPLSAELSPPKPVSKPIDQPTHSTNRISTFLRTRKFDDELEDDEDEQVSPHDCSTRTTSLSQNQERGMLSPVGIASLQDSPTLGRGRRSWQRPMLHGCSKSSRSSSAGRPHSTPGLLLVAPSDVSEKDDSYSSSSGAGTRNSQEIQQMYLGVQRCEGLGNKMFGSSINIPQHTQESPVGRRATSAIISSSTARLFPLSPTGSCPSPSSPPIRAQSPPSTAPADDIADELQASSPPALTSTRSSLLKCERVAQFEEDDLTEMTDVLDCGEETPQNHYLKDDAPTKLASSPTYNTCKLSKEDGDGDDTVIDTVADKALRQEIARLERVRGKWLKLCLEVEDVLKRSRERWPDQDRSIEVLKDFVNPTTRSSIDTFLEKSRRLYKETSGLSFAAHRGDQFTSESEAQELTPPPRHPFGRQSIVSASAGNLRQRTRGRESTTSRQSFLTPSKPRGAKSQGSKAFPLLITLPVPSAFVSPERFRGCAKAPQSEQGPRVLKISNRSRCPGPRQPTISNGLASPGIKLMNACDRRGRMMSGASSSNVSIASNGKVILGERSVNQLADRTLTTGEKKPTNFSPKLSGNNTPTSARTVGSLGRASRPSTGKWGSENEGPLWTSVSVRETRKPWRRSILNQEILPREPRLSLADSATGSVGSAAEEVGVLVAAGEQPSEFSSGFHVSGSLRLKHRRRLHQIRAE
ncbi:hypothetical protein PtA15_13A500 [Puccinia triticina]|uniref:Uncharacterized protein n=1 Tax=Puccinia triticina TaxID=208348 RepID=A0ABY7D0K5_9BASI|nr:uncharacterized protein PtA15_13A500 [Puccinia triticina]WAQ91099.1 hypothetical protein PtA15_13A500 [Puccinia triticina]